MEFTIELDTKFANKTALKNVATEVRNNMIQLAKYNLSPRTSQIYINALTKVTVSGNTAQFMLKGWLPNAIELGCNPFDQKPGMLANPKVKISKKGNPYLAIPISKSPLIIRVVSSKSRPGSWIFPGLVARNFWEKATYKLVTGIK